jgi:hypothetical protein
MSSRSSTRWAIERQGIAIALKKRRDDTEARFESCYQSHP